MRGPPRRRRRPLAGPLASRPRGRGTESAHSAARPQPQRTGDRRGMRQQRSARRHRPHSAQDNAPPRAPGAGSRARANDRTPGTPLSSLRRVASCWRRYPRCATHAPNTDLSTEVGLVRHILRSPIAPQLALSRRLAAQTVTQQAECRHDQREKNDAGKGVKVERCRMNALLLLSRAYFRRQESPLRSCLFHRPRTSLFGHSDCPRHDPLVITSYRHCDAHGVDNLRQQNLRVAVPLTCSVRMSRIPLPVDGMVRKA